MTLEAEPELPGSTRIEEEDEQLLEELAEPFAESEPISFFGSDFDVHGLVRRLIAGDVVVPSFDPPPEASIDLAGFQRGFVWRKYQMDRFIESLLLGYPVPGIFLVQQADRRLLVLDGQQRLRTLHAFYVGKFPNGTAFRLEHVSEPFRGLSYEELSDEDRRALDNNFIHATVVKFNPERRGDEAIYQLFERLNTGGTNLYPHEIRVALYPGKLVDFIRELNEDPNWRLLYGNRSERLKDQELILRFLALYTSASEYRRPLKGFLNDFLKDHRELQGLNADALRERFMETCAILARSVGPTAFRLRRQVNAALVDSVMIGVARRLEQGPIREPHRIGEHLARLLEDETFQTSIARATADEERVATRLGMATETFRSIG